MNRLILIQFFVFLVTCIHAQTIIQFTPPLDLSMSPVKLRVSNPPDTAFSYELVDRQTKKRIPVQFTDNNHIAFIPATPLKAGQSYSFQLVRVRKKSVYPVQIKTTMEGIRVQVGDKPVMFYHTTEAKPPADSPGYYKRSGFIHPLYSPSGKILTDDFPAGHVHQHGVFTAWTSTRFRNHAVDFWNQHQQQGTVEHARVIRITNGPVFGELKTLLHHISLEDGAVLEETWTVRIYALRYYLLIDLHSEQKNITGDTLYLNRYHYGGFAFRGSRQWNADDKVHFRNPWKIITGEGKEDAAANALPARWVDASGIIDNEFAGVTILSHPANFRYPQPIRVHPYMPYWCYAPTVNDSFFIAPGASYESAYRFYIHNGKGEPGQINRLSNEYSFMDTAK